MHRGPHRRRRRRTGAAPRAEPGRGDGPEAAYREAVERRARFLVLDASAAGPRPEVLVRRLRSTSPGAFVIGVGDLPGVDAAIGAQALDGLRDTIRDLLHESGDHQHA